MGVASGLCIGARANKLSENTDLVSHSEKVFCQGK